MHHYFKFPFMVPSILVAASLVEAVILSWRSRGSDKPFNWYEMGISFADMVGRRIVDALPLSVAGPVFSLAWQHRIHTVAANGALALLLVFIGQEFCYYWYHRTAHRVRFFWATHAVHHSPNQLALSTAYRLGWTGKLTGSSLFFAPLVWLGVQPQLAMSMLTINLLYQFWIHTTWIPKLGWLEYIFNTPSAHRVHHASNAHYLDANFGGVLIVFDRLFGTYVSEQKDLPCRYGLVTPSRSRNPLVIEFEHWIGLAHDVMSAKTLSDAFGYVLRPPGWHAGGRGETVEDPRCGRENGADGINPVAGVESLQKH